MSGVTDQLGLIYLKLEAEGHALAAEVKAILDHMKNFVTGGEHKVEEDAVQVAADAEQALAPVEAEVKNDVSGLEKAAEADLAAVDAPATAVDVPTAESAPEPTTPPVA